jgi:NADH-quinone oxidoreductase subunit J
MLLGVDNAMDLSIEPIRVQRPLAAIMGLGLVSLLTAAIVKADSATVLPNALGDGLDIATVTGDSDSNIKQLAENLYGDHIFAFELTSVLLIVAVAGTVVLTRKWPKADADAESANTSGTSK